MNFESTCFISTSEFAYQRQFGDVEAYRQHKEREALRALLNEIAYSCQIGNGEALIKIVGTWRADSPLGLERTTYQLTAEAAIYEEP